MPKHSDIQVDHQEQIISVRCFGKRHHCDGFCGSHSIPNVVPQDFMQPRTTNPAAYKFARKAPSTDTASVASDLAVSDQVEQPLYRG